MIEGAEEASHIRSLPSDMPYEGLGEDILWFTYNSLRWGVYYGVKLNMKVTIVRDWTTYSNVFESESNSIVVNTHGETFPVPSGFTKEEWIGKIASRLMDANMTWVHTTLYPFYYYQQEGDTCEEWGEEGFRQFMSSIGINNTVCVSSSEWKGQDVRTPSTQSMLDLLQMLWLPLDYVRYAEIGCSLRPQDFENRSAGMIWGYSAAYLPGAVIKFSENYNEKSNFGFYVHIGTNQTFDSGGTPVSKSDFWRGYVGTAVAIWTVSLRSTAERFLAEASQAVAQANSDGRTKGLSEALARLQEADRYFAVIHAYDASTVLAMEATQVAQAATRPSLLETYGLYIVAIGGLGIAGITGSVLAVHNRRLKKRTAT
jgi:hypothetical protein